MRVLIADDEIKVCKLVQELVDWDSLGLSVAGVVHDCESALAFIRESRPDIVITDIRMPERGGLEMIRAVRDMGLDTHFIIISGYRQFDYANHAIKYGVEDYLLKPLKQKELERVLLKIVAKRRQLEASEQERSDLFAQLEAHSNQLKTQFLYRLVSGDMDSALLADRRNLNRTYRCHFQPGAYHLLLVRVAPVTDGEQSVRRVLGRKVRELLEGVLEPAFQETVCLEQEGGITCLLNDAPEAFAGLRRHLHRAASGIQAQRDIFGPLDVVMALSLPVTELTALPQCVLQVEKAAAQRIFLPAEDLIEYREDFEPAEPLSSLLPVGLRGDIKKKIDVLDGAGMEDCLKTLRGLVDMYRVHSGWQMRQLYVQVLSLLEAGAMDSGRELPRTALEDARRAFASARSMDDVFAALGDAFGRVFQAWHAEKELEGSRPIREAKKYIHDHYQEPLTLQQVSEVAGLNPTYFSGIFKRETGQTFVDYLTQARVEAAKTYLMQTDLSISDVVEKVGYTDMKYFYKKFKQATGLSPRDYQKLYH